MEELSESNTPDKQEILRRLCAAKSAQIEWCAYTQGLTRAQADTSARMQFVETRSRFGSWYHDSGRRLTLLKNFNQVTRSRQKLQHVSTRFFSRMFLSEAHELPVKWFRSRSEGRLRMENQARLNKELEALKPQLKQASKQLISSITALETEIRNIPNGALQTLYATPRIDMDFEASLLLN